MPLRTSLFISVPLILSVIAMVSCKSEHQAEIRNDFKKYYDHYQVEGSFVLYDQNAEKYILYNEAQFKEPFIPASTFKICNSLIGLETGVISNENFLIPWDSIKRNPAWDRDHTLKSAFQASAVWYYQELARRVGGEQMKFWLDKTSYGNADTNGGIDRFWLTGGLRISPEQQIDFLKQLHDNKLPFSQRSIDMVKNIMIAENTPGYILRAKTGWSRQSGNEIGWYIGYVETKSNAYYFSNCIQLSSRLLENEDRSDLFIRSRKEITMNILRLLNIPASGTAFKVK